MLPYVFRIVMGVIVDFKFIARRSYVMSMNFISTIFNLMIAFKFVDSPGYVCLMLATGNFFHQILESV